MKKKVTYFVRCEHCKKTEEFIMRAGNVNSDMSDTDILQIMVNNADHPHEIKYCEKCKMETLQTTTAWKGTV